MAKPGSALLAAYRKTSYRVFSGEVSIPLSIGMASKDLGALLRGHDARTACLVTAWNPASEPREAQVNLAANERLRQEMDARGLTSLPAEGCDPDGLWPCEESLLVLELSRETALQLCRRYEQNAVVWIEVDAIPALLLADGTLLA